VPFLAGVLVIADQFLLLGIDRDDRLAAPLERPDLAVDVLELGVAVGVILPLLRLAVGLQVITELRQEARHRLMADVMPQGAEGLGEVACALARPEQGRHRIAARGGIDEIVKILEQGAIASGQAGATTARTADAPPPPL